MTISFSVGEQKPPSDTLPFRILVVADLGGSQPLSESFLFHQPADLQRLLRAVKPDLMVQLPNQLGGSPTLSARFSPETLKDFSPDRLAAHFEPLSRVHQLIEVIDAIVKGEQKIDTLDPLLESCADLNALAQTMHLCREAQQGGDSKERSSSAPSAANPATAKAENDASVSRILDMVETPNVEKRAASAIGSLVHAIGTSRKKTKCPPQLEQALELAVSVFGRQLDLLLHDPRINQLESTWRGLKTLVDAADFRRNVELEVLHSSHGGLAEVLQEEVIQPVNDGRVSPPDLIVAPLQLQNPATDAELLQKLAECGEDLQTPVLTSIGAGFLGLEEGGKATNLRYLGTLFETAEYTKWNVLREKSCARWLCIGFNRFLLRDAYGIAEGTKTKIPYSETISSNTDRLWGDPSWAIASLAARSFARFGWSTQITGTENGRLSNLSIHKFYEKGKALGQIPLEAFLSQEQISDFKAAGISALFAPLDNDNACLLHAPTLFHSVKRSAGRTPSLPYQLLASRISLHLSEIIVELLGSTSEDEVKHKLESALHEIIADTGIGASVSARVKPNPKQRAYAVHLEVRTGRGILGGVGLELEFNISA